MSLRLHCLDGEYHTRLSVTETKRVLESHTDLIEALDCLLGLLQLLQGRADVSPELSNVLLTNHRVIEARAAIARAEGQA